MERQAVESTMARSIGYNPKAMTLEIEFRSGEIWQYLDVPEQIYRELMEGSIGQYFQFNIKNQFRETRVR